MRQSKVIAPDRMAALLSGSARRKPDQATAIKALFDLAESRSREHQAAEDISAHYTDSMSESTHRAQQRLSGPSGQRVALHRDELLEVLRRHGVTNPEIFGSTARGDDREDSDLDLLVDFAPGTDLIDMANIKAELEAVLGASVDLIPRDGLKDRVRISAALDVVPL